MSRHHLKAIFEHAMLLVALGSGGLMTFFLPPDRQSAVVSKADDPTNNVATENPLLDTIGFDVDARYLVHFGAIC